MLFVSTTAVSWKLEPFTLIYALSTKRCMLGNQDRSLARVVLFLLCSPILSPLEVVSRAMYDDFTQSNEVRNFSRMHSTIFATFSRPFGSVSL